LRYRRLKNNKYSAIALTILIFTGCASGGSKNSDGAVASNEQVNTENSSYLIQPGDVLHISIWREPELNMEAVVRPDGSISYPLIGEVVARGKTIQQLREEITTKAQHFIPDANVMVTATQLQGNKIYVIGKVNRPGEFAVNRPVDVIQALSIAGGATPFADLDDIIVLRRQNDTQQVFEFDYDDVKTGNSLSQNIILKSGDVVVVP
jgi:polysaccharide export outer membrane protein